MGTGVSGFLKLMKAIGEVADAIDKAANAPPSGERADRRTRGQRTAETLERAFEEMGAERESARRRRKQAERSARSAYHTLTNALSDALRQVYLAEWHANHALRKKYESAARRLATERNLLRIEPHREPLLDRAVADTELAASRDQLEASLRTGLPQVEKVMAEYRARAAREADAFDPSGELKAEWLRRIDSKFGEPKSSLQDSVARIRAVIDRLDTDLAELRKEITPDVAGPRPDPSEALASLRYGASLTPGDLAALADAIRNPRSLPLKALFGRLAEEERPPLRSSHRAEPLPGGLTQADAARLVADCFERAIAIGALEDMGYRGVESVRALGPIADLCNALLRGLEQGVVQFEGEDAERIGRALVLASETKHTLPAAGRINWARLAPGFRPDNAFSPIPADTVELAQLVDRLEASARRTMGKPLSDREAGSFASYHFPVLAALRRATGLSERGPAAEAWDRYLADRHARREEYIARVSPFWRPIFEQLIDLRRPGEREEAQTLRAAFEPFAAMDEGAKAAVLAEVRELRADVRLSNSWDLISWADDGQELRPSCYSWGRHVLLRLEELLSRPAVEQSAYFAPPPDMPPLGDFAIMSLSFGEDPRDNLVDGQIVPLMVEGRLDEAEAELRAWLDRAPPSALRDRVLAARWEDMELSGWDRAERWTAMPATAAIGLDLSDHVTSEIRSLAEDVPFEMARYEDGPFAFSGETVESMRAHIRSGREPWRGNFAEADLGPAIVGLAPVLLALRKFRDEPRYDWPKELHQLHGAVDRLAATWCYLCANRLVARELERRSWSRPLPVILGVHDFGYFPSVAHLAKPSR